ncbi:MAG: hypothetical protein K0Q92_267 [Steroidobacteraceae bacterium]|nr:hypothetical protein [Steroidobacteraceae bacterium]
MKRLTLVLVSIAAASAALATTYVRVEKDGSKTYSDRPLPGGQPVELESVQTYSAPQSSVSSSANSNIPSEQRSLQGIDDFVYESCTITPENDATFTNPENVSIGVSLSPGLRPGDSVNLVVDGKAANPQSTHAVLQPADRGTHTAAVTLKDSHGRVLCSASVSFHVIRPSLNQPRRR